MATKQANDRPQPPDFIQEAINEIVWYNGPDPLLWPSTVFLGLAAKDISVQHLSKRRLDIAAQKCIEETKKRLTDSRFGRELKEGFTTQDPVAPDKANPVTRQNLIKRLMRLRELRKHRSDNGSSGAGIFTNLKEKIMTKTALQVRESEFRSVLGALGIPGGEDSKKSSLKKLNQWVSDKESFADLLNNAKEGASPEGAEKDLLSNISDTLAEGGDVEIVKDEKFNGQATEETTMTAVATKKKSHKAQAQAGNKGARKGSLVDAALSIMKKNPRKSWKPQDLYDEVMKRGLWQPGSGKTPAATLGAALYAEVKHKGNESRFVKTDDGFALNV